MEFLTQGTAADAARTDIGSYVWSVFNFSYNILGLVAAFGLWRRQRWGSVLALLVVALNVINLFIGISSGELDAVLIVFGGIFVALYILVAVLILRNPSTRWMIP